MNFYLFVLIQAPFVLTATYQKPVADKLWNVRCKKNTYVLNDCNWCWCSENHYYRCKARLCEEVDVFGHFKDAIQEIDVGMEGHGVWRSTRDTSCLPGVQYRRGSVHCICDKDGNWPNPVCRDLFRILHDIEVIDGLEEAAFQTCLPTKFYLVGCNVCVCPSTGKLDPNICTNRTCHDNDPVLAPKETNSRKASTKMKNDELEIYAPCQLQKVYSIGCQKCKCLANNRLICDDCMPNNKKEKNIAEIPEPTLCSGKLDQVIKMGCNLCVCHTKDYMYCSARKCLSRNKGLILTLNRHEYTGKLVDAPFDDQDCLPGTTYKRDCNICYCKIHKGKKVFGCTARPCQKSILEDITKDCMTGSIYEMDCYVCQCDEFNGMKHQFCKLDSKCTNNVVSTKKTSLPNLDDIHGYCEPVHMYKKDCNTCRCLANGKITKCTTKVCIARSSEPITVDIVPLQQAHSEFCPSGYSYKADCNVCICLLNGNALCTTADCGSEHLELLP